MEKQSICFRMATIPDVELTPTDIPGAELLEPLEKHTVPALKWWMMCRGCAVPSSLKKSDLISKLVTSKILLYLQLHLYNSLVYNTTSTIIMPCTCTSTCHYRCIQWAIPSLLDLCACERMDTSMGSDTKLDSILWTRSSGPVDST